MGGGDKFLSDRWITVLHLRGCRGCGAISVGGDGLISQVSTAGDLGDTEVAEGRSGVDS